MPGVVAVALALSVKNLFKLKALLCCSTAGALKLVCKQPDADLGIRGHD